MVTCTCKLLGTLEESDSTQQDLSRLSVFHNQLQNHSLSIPSARIEELHDQINRLRTSSPSPNCGPGLWQRVAFLNMSDPSQQCPSAWREYSANGVRACGRPRNYQAFQCSSKTYLVSGPFRKVCG